MSLANFDNKYSSEYSREYICIVCTCAFKIFPKANYIGDQPNQTLLCPGCMDALKNSINREKTQNYGW